MNRITSKAEEEWLDNKRKEVNDSINKGYTEEA